MSFSVDVLANIAIELQRGIGHQDRFQRLITTLRQVLECDASALLRYDSRQFIPLAIDGLAKEDVYKRQAEANKCDLCNHREDGPACMAACPTHALICVDRNKLEQLSAEKRRRTALMF